LTDFIKVKQSEHVQFWQQSQTEQTVTFNFVAHVNGHQTPSQKFTVFNKDRFVD